MVCSNFRGKKSHASQVHTIQTLPHSPRLTEQGQSGPHRAVPGAAGAPPHRPGSAGCRAAGRCSRAACPPASRPCPHPPPRPCPCQTCHTASGQPQPASAVHPFSLFVGSSAAVPVVGELQQRAAARRSHCIIVNGCPCRDSCGGLRSSALHILITLLSRLHFFVGWPPYSLNCISVWAGHPVLLYIMHFIKRVPGHCSSSAGQVQAPPCPPPPAVLPMLPDRGPGPTQSAGRWTGSRVPADTTPQFALQPKPTNVNLCQQP